MLVANSPLDGITDAATDVLSFGHVVICESRREGYEGGYGMCREVWMLRRAGERGGGGKGGKRGGGGQPASQTGGVLIRKGDCSCSLVVVERRTWKALLPTGTQVLYFKQLSSYVTSSTVHRQTGRRRSFALAPIKQLNSTPELTSPSTVKSGKGNRKENSFPVPDQMSNPLGPLGAWAPWLCKVK